MKNIEILVELKKMAEKADLLMEDLAMRLQLDDVELDELISEEDEDIYEIFEQIGKINSTLCMLTEDLRSSLGEEGFDCEEYSLWCNQLNHDAMRLTGLIETFEEAHTQLEFYINETIRGYRILTQDGYGTKE